MFERLRAAMARVVTLVPWTAADLYAWTARRGVARVATHEAARLGDEDERSPRTIHIRTRIVVPFRRSPARGTR